jgi:hypothetical protein
MIIRDGDDNHNGETVTTIILTWVWGHIVVELTLAMVTNFILQGIV